MKSLKTVLALALAAALVLSLNLTAFAESLPIGIPDDGTNLSRGIKLLETAGLITVDPEAGYTPEIADITGIILTKLDGTAKGGIVISISDEFDIPVKYIGVGEGVDDMQPFVPSEFADALFDGRENW